MQRIVHTLPACARLPRDLSRILLNASLFQKRISNYPVFQVTLLYLNYCMLSVSIEQVSFKGPIVPGSILLSIRSSAGAVVISLSDQPTLRDVVCFAVPRVAPKWYDLGLALDVQPFVLDTIFQEQKCPDQPRTMFVKWLEESLGTGSQPRTWQSVLDAVGMICGLAAMEDIRSAVQTPRISTAGESSMSFPVI